MISKYEKQFTEILCRIMGVNKLDENWVMNEIAEWDSLKHIQLLSEIEEELNISLDYEEIATMTSIKRIDEVLSNH